MCLILAEGACALVPDHSILTDDDMIGIGMSFGGASLGGDRNSIFASVEPDRAGR